MPAAESIREPAVAGLFYPGRRSELLAQLDELLGEADVTGDPSAGPVVGAVAPHAGYMYSGLTAAYLYNVLRGSDVPAVVLVGPSHREFFRSVSVYDGRGFRTPLGELPTDTGLRSHMLASGHRLIASAAGHRQEHALEVQLPFLQRVLPGVRIVPVTMGVQDRETCMDLAECLAGSLKGSAALLLASSDLSHYHPYDVAVQLDRRAGALIEAFDPEGFLEGLETDRIEACGGGPVAAVMLASRMLGARSSRVLHACNSGDRTGDRTSVVGYLSAVFTS